jgi:hydroxylamine reductase (hybrid-cluster protein)
MAQSAVLDARATVLGLVANQAKKDFFGHGECLTFRNNLPRIVPSSKDKIKSRCAMLAEGFGCGGFALGVVASLR